MVARKEHYGARKISQGVEYVADYAVGHTVGVEQVSRYENGVNGGVLSRPDHVVEAEEGLLSVNVTANVQVGCVEEGERPRLAA